jgi:AP endonuclease-1
MPKRRVLIKHESTESELSPPPTDLPDEEPSTIAEPSERARKKRKVKTEPVEVQIQPSVKVKPRRGTAVKEEVVKEEKEAPTSATSASKTKRKAEVAKLDVKPAVGSRGKRKTKEEKQAEAMPLLERTVGQKLFIGAHVSSAGGQSCFIVGKDNRIKSNNTLLSLRGHRTELSLSRS